MVKNIKWAPCLTPMPIYIVQQYAWPGQVRVSTFNQSIKVLQPFSPQGKPTNPSKKGSGFSIFFCKE